MIDYEIIIALITGLILFLFGIEHFSKEIMNVAGDRFRKILTKLTKNRFIGAIFGVLVTAIIQSSTATSVITISLVNAGLISFLQSSSIILGALVGTTITSQLVALKLTKFAPIFISLGFLISIFGKKHKFWGKPIFYFGLLFFGLNFMSMGIAPLKDDPAIINIFSSLTNPFIALIVGLIFTALVQSSSVTAGITILLTQSGLIGLEQGMFFLLGANMGTTITSFIASRGMNLYAKRTAVTHMIFAIIGSIVVFPIVHLIAKLVVWIGGNPGQELANAHTIFSIITLIIFLIILPKFIKLVEFIVPGKEKEILFKTKYIKDPMPENNTEYFIILEKELKYSIEITYELFKTSMKLLKNTRKKDVNLVEKLETLNDYLDDQIENSIFELSKRKLTDKEAKKTILLVRISNAIENLGDQADSIKILATKITNKGITFTPESTKSAKKLYYIFNETLKNMKNNFPNLYLNKSTIENEKKILNLINGEFKRHFKTLKNKTNYSGSIFVESISIIEGSIQKIREIRSLIELYKKQK